MRHIDAEDIADRRPANAAERYIKAFARYLSGRRVNFDPEAFGLDETCDEMGMTELERAIAHALAGVKWGERISYGELAARAGRPRRAARGGRVLLVALLRSTCCCPAHRVVRSDGSLGEYGAHGVAYKQRLLDLETRREPSPPDAHRLPGRRHRASRRCCAGSRPWAPRSRRSSR